LIEKDTDDQRPEVQVLLSAVLFLEKLGDNLNLVDTRGDLVGYFGS
jgi:hypothetical protein